MFMDRNAEMLEQAIAHHRDRRLVEAEAMYRQIVLAEPRHADALYLWGRLEFDRGEFARAVELIEQAIAVDPQEATFRFHLGEAQRAQGLLEPAVRAYRQALTFRADYALAWCSLGMSLDRLDQHQEAEQAFRQALRVQPSFAEALTNLAALVRRQGRWDEARQLLQAALQLRPDLVEAWNNLGNALRDGGLQLEATQAYDHAIALAPQYGAAHFNRGLALTRLGDTSAAADAFRKATRLDPADAEAWTNLSATLNDLGQPDDAETAACQAIALRPGSAEAHGNLGVALQAQGAQEEAIAHYRQAVEFDPCNAGQHGNLLYALNYHADYDPAMIFAEHRAWARRHADPLTAVAAAHAPRPLGGRRLRIGYVSAHFRAHAVNAFAEPLLAAHDHQRFEVICYANQPAALCDDTTARLQAQADQWRDIYSLNDEQAAALIRADQVDILVDLTGHIAGNRLLVFARKPAPIQVTYLGYQNTTGMRAMDYRLTDGWADPAGQTDCWYTEQLVRLPDAFFCYKPWDGAPEVASSPLALNGYVTFG
jgi:predicted O-linked N-acetylglucosamine transferase (SPINDLY family)